MVRYEVLLLTVPEITGDEASALEKGLESLAKTAKGSMVSFERWGKYRLAYPIKKNEYGVYFLARMELPQESLREVLEEVRAFYAFKHVNLVMRSMVSRLNAQGSLEYYKPEPVDIAPSRDVNTFLRENKMSGLLSSVADEEQGDDDTE